MAFVRERAQRVFERWIGTALQRLPALEQSVSRRVEARRLNIALTRLQRRGVSIEVVYDIGAHRGDWTRSMKSCLPSARFFLFEANEAHAEALRQTGHQYFFAVLSSEPKPVDFYATGGPGDSYLRESSKHYAAVEPCLVTTTTLDEVVDHHALPKPDFIKADVQGAELDVLRGGEAALAHAKLVLLECPFIEYNENAPSISEYLSFLLERDFTPIEFVNPTWLKRRMTHVDILFARVGI
jgi:FkbM family methyltransferase